MAFPTIFNSLAAGSQSLALVDTMFSVVGSMGGVQCTATGTNTIALSPNTNMPTQASYVTAQLYGFVAAATTSGTVTLNVSGLGAKNLYKTDGVTQATTGDLVSGVYYIVVYNSALNSAAGGFQIIAPQVSSSSTVSPVLGAATNLVSVQASSTTITVTADEMIVGTALAGTFSKVSSVSLTFNGAGTGANGMDTGAIPTSGFLYLYLISQANGASPALLGTISGSGAAIYAGANMPATYTMSNLVGAYRTDGSAHINYFKQYGRKTWIATTNALNITSSVPTSFTSVSLSGVVPPNAKTISGTFGSPAASAAGFIGSLAGDSSGTSEVIMNIGYPGATYANYATCAQYSELPLITAQTFYYKALNSSTQTRVDINAYTI